MKYRVLKDFVNKKGILHKVGEIVEWGAEGNFLHGLLDGGFVERVNVLTEASEAIGGPIIAKYQYHLTMDYEEFVHKTRRLDSSGNQYKYEIPEKYDCVKSRLLYIELLETKGFTL